MAFPMNPKEFEKWTETRKQGSTKYSVKTSLFTTIVVFFLFFLTNAYIHLDNIDKYIAYNLGDAPRLGVTLLVMFIALFVCSKMLFNITEKRYQETLKKGK